MSTAQAGGRDTAAREPGVSLTITRRSRGRHSASRRVAVSAPAPAGGGGGDTARRVVVSTGTQLGARAFHLVLNVGTTVAVIRYLGPDNFGDYNKVVTVAGWAGLVAEFGLMKMAVRESTRERDEAGSIIGTAIVTRLLLAVVAAAFVQLILLAIGASRTVHAGAAVSSGLFVTEALLTTVVVFHVELRQQFEAIIRVLMEVVEVAILVAVIVSDRGLVWLLAAPVLAGFAGSAMAWWWADRRFALSLSFDPARVRSLLVLAAPVVPAVLIGVLTVKLDNFMVAAMRSRRESGLYGAAYQPIEYAFLAISVICYPFFPVLVRHQGSNIERFRMAYQRGTEALLAFVLPVPALLITVATPAVHAVYRGEFDDSALPLQLLGVALVFMALSAWHGFVLLSGDRQKLTTSYSIAALSLSLVLCLVLIPHFGFRAAAWAAIAANVMSAVWSGLLVRRELGVNVQLVRTARVCLAAVLFGVTAGLCQIVVPWWAATVLAMVSYPLWLVLTGVIDRELLAAIRSRPPAADVTGPDPTEASTVTRLPL